MLADALAASAARLKPATSHAGNPAALGTKDDPRFKQLLTDIDTAPAAASTRC